MPIHGAPISADIMAELMAEYGEEETYDDADGGDSDDHGRFPP